MANRHLLLIVTVLTSVWGSWGALDCDSQLRILFPQWFTHCPSCSYSDWSEWQFVQDSIVDVPTSQCDSRQSYRESRSRSAIGDGCVSDTETKVICLPDREGLLIEALGLGGQNGPPATSSFGTDFEEVGPVHRSWASLNRCPGTGNSGSICTDPSYGSRGKRSMKREYQTFKRATQERKEPDPLPEAPIPYDRKEHGGRFRRSHQRNCQPHGTQYILFVLDTSGSIGQVSFNKMTDAVSKLTALFCKSPKIAVLTFNHNFNLEFCFDCFPTDPRGREDAAAAINNIPYRGGWTHTGGAAKCICDELLQPACGMHPYATCIDVVFITDGKSNDPDLEVCNEVKCLHNHFNQVNTYAIGIGNVNSDEINCISSSSNLISVFKYESFEEFDDAIDTIICRLRQSEYLCINSDGNLGDDHSEDDQSSC